MVIQKHLERLLQYGILQPCQSFWNMPLLPVQKPGIDDYWGDQNLCVVNQAAVTLHLVVLNPYTFLGLIPIKASFFTCLELKMLSSASYWPSESTNFYFLVGES